MKSIRTKLLVFMLLFILIPLVITGYFSTSIAESVLKTKINDSNQAALSVLNKYINSIKQDAESRLKMLAESNTIMNYDGSSASDEAVLEKLEEVKKSMSNVINVYFATPDKKMILYPPQKLENYDPTEKQWYKDAEKAGGNIVWTDPYEDFNTKVPKITVTKTITDSSGKLVGVLGIDISLEQLSKNISSIKLGKTGYIYIVTKDGITITHPDSSKLFTSIKQYDFGERLLNTNNATIQYSSNNVYKFASVRNLDSFGWKAVVTMENSELTKDVTKIRNFVITVSIIVLFIGFLIAYFFANSISSGIKRL